LVVLLVVLAAGLQRKEQVLLEILLQLRQVKGIVVVMVGHQTEVVAVVVVLVQMVLRVVLERLPMVETAEMERLLA
jgi:ABC-type branched-subunit amino acid transport system ATPase component